MSKQNSKKLRKGPRHIGFTDIIHNKLVLVALAGEKVTADYLRKNGARDVLILDRTGNLEAVREDQRVQQRYARLSDVGKNNCNVAILHGKSALAVIEKQKFGQFTHILVPMGLTQFAVLIGLLRYGRRKFLMVTGKTNIDCHGKRRGYTVLEAHANLRDNRRQYGPSGCSPLELMKRLSDLDYVALRWTEMMEKGTHEGDIDLLVSSAGLKGLLDCYSQEISTYPLDVYTDDGQGGFAYKSVPYFTHKLAKELLKSATLSAEGIRVSSPFWRFLAFCYHLIFHGKSKYVRPGTTEIDPNTFPKPHYYPELQRLAKLADQPVPRTFDDIETLLRDAGVMPSLDLIGFYSNKNAFLKKRYFEHAPMKVGLATFFIRDFGSGQEKVPDLRAQLLGHFEILAEGPVDETNRERVLKGVRGGNWADRKAPGGVAEPVYWFVCWDATPQQPSARTKRKHPRVDNERIRLKDTLRRDLATQGHKAMRIIHSSDNSLEALDHLEHLGLRNHPAIISRLEKEPEKRDRP